MLALLAVVGHVEATTARWSGDAIVTEVRVREPDGSVATIVELGGSVNGIGMTFSHLPAPARVGDEVRVASATVASYGLMRTTMSQRPLHREDGCIHFTIDAAGTAQLPGDSEMTAFDRAFVTWKSATDSCGNLMLSRSIATNVPYGADGIESVHFHDDRWCRPASDGVPEICYPDDVAAMTRVVFIDNPSADDDGRIIEADMEINAVDYALQLDGVTTTSTGTPIDLVSVVTHEIGHALGLAHDCASGDGSWPEDADGNPVPSCDDADAAHVAATMYVSIPPNDISRRQLQPSDIEAACIAVAPSHCTPVTGGCSAGGTPGWLLALAMLAAKIGATYLSRFWPNLGRARRRIATLNASTSIAP
jgi:hypothetical protein